MATLDGIIFLPPSGGREGVKQGQRPGQMVPKRGTELLGGIGTDIGTLYIGD